MFPQQSKVRIAFMIEPYPRPGFLFVAFFTFPPITSPVLIIVFVTGITFPHHFLLIVVILVTGFTLNLCVCPQEFEIRFLVMVKADLPPSFLFVALVTLLSKMPRMNIMNSMTCQTLGGR